MKPVLRMLLLASLAAGLAHAGPATSGTVTYASAYVFRGLRLAHQSLQPDLTVTDGPFSGGVWMNLPLTRGEKPEVDPNFAWSFEHGGVAWEAGLALYLYPRAHDEETRYSWEPYLSATSSWGRDDSNSGTVSVAYDGRLATLSLEASLGHTFTLNAGGRTVTLTPAIFAGYVAGTNLTPDAPEPRTRDGYRYGGLRVEAACALNDRITLTLGAQWDDAANVSDGADLTRNLWGYAAVRCNW